MSRYPSALNFFFDELPVRQQLKMMSLAVTPAASCISLVNDLLPLFEPIQQMQNIFHHSSSGRTAFTGPLKSREVHRAITLHPIKEHAYMYRLNNFLQVSLP